MTAYIANWKNPSEYPPLKCSDRLYLAWEFLRRNKNYAKHVEQMLQLADKEFTKGVKANSDSCLDGLDCWPPAKPGETARQYFQRMKKEEQKGLIIKPEQTFINRWALSKPIDPSENYAPSIIEFQRHNVGLKRHAQLAVRQFRLNIHANEAAVRFRLDMPIKQQLVLAEKRLQAAANEFEKALNELPKRDRDESAIRLNRVFREKHVMQIAHYYLRSYDAFAMPPKSLGDKKRRRANENGETNVRQTFKNEPSGIKPIQRGVPKAWAEAADHYINGKKYLTLLYADDKG